MTITPDTFPPHPPSFPCNIITFPSMPIPYHSLHLWYAPPIPFNCNVLGKLHHILCDAFPILHGPHCPFSYISAKKEPSTPLFPTLYLLCFCYSIRSPVLLLCKVSKILKGTDIVSFSSVQSLSCVQQFMIPRTAARWASLSITNSWSLLNLMSIESVMPSNHLILCLLFL